MESRQPGSNKTAIVIWWLILSAAVALAVLHALIVGWTVGPVAAVVLYALALLARHACNKAEVPNWYVPFFGFIMVQLFGLMDALK